MLTLRAARLTDITALRTLAHTSIETLLARVLTPEALAASFAIMGVDTLLIEDGTYLVAEIDGALAGCGGWSRRATLYGGDHTQGRDAARLDPTREPARVRAMYTAPAFERRGVGRAILAAAEDQARAEGFSVAELAATLGGLPLYERAGYQRVEAFTDSSGGYPVPLVRMRKRLD